MDPQDQPPTRQNVIAARATAATGIEETTGVESPITNSRIVFRDNPEFETTGTNIAITGAGTPRQSQLEQDLLLWPQETAKRILIVVLENNLVAMHGYQLFAMIMNPTNQVD